MSRPQAIPTVQISNERAIVTEWRFPPGAETGWHRRICSGTPHLQFFHYKSTG
jgi:hypothetical protein